MRSAILTSIVALAASACSGQLEPAGGGDDDGGGEAMPLYVAEAFGRSCGNASCHGGTVSPSLTADAAPAILGADSSAGPPLVVLGDLQASYIAIKMLDDSLVDASLRVGDMMPPPGQVTEPADLTIILGWIGSTPPGAGDGGSGDSGGSSDGGAVCGDDVLDEGEDCDGAELNGATCMSLGFADGTLACASDCTLDLSACTCADVPTDLSHATDIAPLWVESCALAGCHVTGATAPDLEADPYMTLLDGSSEAFSLDWVVASDLDMSYLFQKISGTQADVGGGGGQMPYPPGVLTVCDAGLIEAWISQGAMP